MPMCIYIYIHIYIYIMKAHGGVVEGVPFCIVFSRTWWDLIATRAFEHGYVM